MEMAISLSRLIQAVLLGVSWGALKVSMSWIKDRTVRKSANIALMFGTSSGIGCAFVRGEDVAMCIVIGLLVALFMVISVKIEIANEEKGVVNK